MYDNTTAILGPESEPQPDAYLIIAPEKGGQTWLNRHGYLEGPPELIAEVAISTESIDLHAKKDDYEQAGVREYLVVAVRQSRVFWFARRRGKFVELTAQPDGLLRSQVFPGLWLDPAALLRRYSRRLIEVLHQGISTREHAEFSAKLAKKG